MDITIKEFVQNLWKFHDYTEAVSTSSSGEPVSSSGLTRRSLSMDNFCKNSKDILHYGHIRGWLEDQDEVEADSILVRRSAARILHQFMKIELKIPDLADISAADKLKDLYTCRTCVNHVAQIYLRNLIPAEEMEFQNQQILIFNMMKPVSEDEMYEILKKLDFIVS